MARLDRIEAMELAGASVALLLNELGRLLPEAGRWLELQEPAPETSEARAVLERFRCALSGNPDFPRHSPRSGSVTAGGEEHSLVCPCVESGTGT
jgi:hypothetical protein